MGEGREKSISRLSAVVDVALFLFVILLAVGGSTVLHRLTGSSTPLAVVEGTSMLPLLREGDMVVIARKAPRDIHVNDIVVYKSVQTGRLIIHRVVDVENVGSRYYYRVKGDNNWNEDFQEYYERVDGILRKAPGVPYERIIGVVVKAGGMHFKIPYVGFFSLLIHR